MPRTAVFRCDASPRIGGGHATRSLALADALAQIGWQTTFAVGPDSVATIPPLARHRIVTLNGDSAGEPDEIQATLKGPVDWLVVDHNEWDERFESDCRKWAAAILVIADFPTRRHECDLLLDQTIGRESEAERGMHVPRVPPHCRLLLGMDYALVRHQFTRRRVEAKERRALAVEAQRLLLSFGATDPFGLTSRILAALLTRNPAFHIDVVTGTPPGAETAALAALHVGRVTLRHSVEDMGALMLAADVAVGLAGTSGSERCTLGLPSALFVPSEHYRAISERFSNAGACEIVGRESFDETAAAGAILTLAGDKERLALMSTAAFAVCDGLGATRTANEMRALTEARQ